MVPLSSPSPSPKPKPKKISINKRMIVWELYNGKVWSAKCYTPVCPTIVTVRNFDVGHDVPSSLGGSLDVNNLRPICRACNVDMGNRYCIEGPSGYNASMHYARPSLLGRLARYVSRQADVWATWAFLGTKTATKSKKRYKRVRALKGGERTRGPVLSPRSSSSSSSSSPSHTAARAPRLSPSADMSRSPSPLRL